MKIYFIASCILLISAISFLIGFYSAAKENFIYSFVTSIYDAARDLAGGSPMTVANDFGEAQGLTHADDAVDPGYLLLSAFYPEEARSGIKLIRLADAVVVKSWYPDPEQIRERSDYPEFSEVERFEPQSPLLMKDGGLIFIDNQGPLVRVDRCSKVEWIVDGRFHHSIEYGPDGTLLVPFATERAISGPAGAPEPTWSTEFRDDAVAVVTLDGRLLSVEPVVEMLLRHGYRGFVFGMGLFSEDPIHLNDVEVAKQTTRNWARGDWLLSLRARSALMLYRPALDQVVWVKTGPWTLQHDPDFLDDGRISIFGNDVYQLEKGNNRFLDRSSNVYIFDPATDASETPWEDVLRTNGIRTPTQGKATILENGDIFVEETDRGRLVRAGKEGLVWSYYNTYGDEAGVLHWSRYIDADDLSGVDLTQAC